MKKIRLPFSIDGGFDVLLFRKGENMKKGIIFDMDGTMFDTESIYHKGWELMARRYGQVFNPEFQIAACGTTGETMRKIVNEYYPEVDPESFIKDCSKWVEEQVRSELPEKPGLHEILHYAKAQGWKMAVASGSRLEMIEHNLKKAGIYDLFDTFASGHEVENGKPAPDVFLLAAERLGLNPEECYVIEDGANGVRAAVAAGCDTIMVPDLIQPDEELRKSCTQVCGSLLDVRDYFQEM